MSDPSEAAGIVDFWREAGRKAWFRRNPAFDEAIRNRFEAAHHAAARGERPGWIDTPRGAVALLLLLDQVPRNLYRDSAHAFATDPLARAAARAAIGRGHDRATEPALRLFFYLPFSHSEDLADQLAGVRLTEALEREGGESATSARRHLETIRRFGRFPHRNAALGRETTAEEKAFLAGGGFAG